MVVELEAPAERAVAGVAVSDVAAAVGMAPSKELDGNIKVVVVSATSFKVKEALYIEN